jgi:N-acetylglucosamine kinase-like BadF-type ATPase
MTGAGIDSGPETVDGRVEPLLVAVDGGASKTDVWIVGTDGSVLGSWRGEGCNHQLVGLDAAVAALGASIDQAADRSGLGHAPRPVAPLGLYCLAGLDLPIDEQRLGPAITGARWTTRDVVRNDTFAVSRAGSKNSWGIGVVCGSGLNCAGVGPDGRTVRFPSLAELSGDFAPGGAWLGVRALGLALRARDGRGQDTTLTALVPKHFSMNDPEEVLAAVYSGELSYGRLFELARIALEAAREGDGPAQDAVAFLADEVVAMAGAAITRLDVAGEAVEVVLGGGIFESGDEDFTARVEDGLRHIAPLVVCRRPEGPPVLGAALMGLDIAEAAPAAFARLRADAAQLGA